MVTPAMQLAHKIPDINVQLWATALLRDLYNICGDSQKAQVPLLINDLMILFCTRITRLVSSKNTTLEWLFFLNVSPLLQEAYQSHTAFSQQLLRDHFSASQRPEHALINWTQGPVPASVLRPTWVNDSLKPITFILPRFHFAWYPNPHICPVDLCAIL